MATALERLKKGRWLFIQRLLSIDCFEKTHFLYTSLSACKDVNKDLRFCAEIPILSAEKREVCEAV